MVSPSSSPNAQQNQSVVNVPTCPLPVDVNTRSRQLWDLAVRLRIVAELGQAPADHPTVQTLSAVAQSLRDAANNDPVLSFLGVKLPHRFSCSIVFDRTPNAFVFRGHAEICYLHSGSLPLLERFDDVVSIIAHEQGHLIRDAILERLRKQERPKVRERFGEKIWRPDSSYISVDDALTEMIARVGSRSEEIWCNTHGSLCYLDKIGVDTRSVARVESRLASSAESIDGAPVTWAENFFQALKSHPHTRDSIWIEQFFERWMCFPVGLGAVTNRVTAPLVVPQDVAAKTFVENLDELCGMFSAQVLPSNMGIPRASINIAARHFSHSLRSLQQTSWNFLLGLSQDLAIALDEESKLSVNQWSCSDALPSGDPEKLLGLKAFAKLFPKSVLLSASNSGEFPDAVLKYLSDAIENRPGDYVWKPADSSESTASHEIWLGDLAKLFEGKELLGTRWIEPLFHRFMEGRVPVLTSAEDGELARVLYDLSGSNKELRREDRVTPRSISVSSTVPLVSLNEFARRYRRCFELQDICREVTEILTKRAIASAQADILGGTTGGFDDLVRLASDLTRFVSPAGPLLDYPDLADCTLHYVLTRSEGELTLLGEMLDKMCEVGLRPSQFSFDKISGILESSPGMTESSSVQEIMNLLIAFFPECIEASSPDALSPFNDWGTNIHEELATNRGDLTVRGHLSASFLSSHKTLASAVAELDKYPCLLPVGTWVSVAEAYVHTLEEYKTFAAFLSQRFAQHPRQFSNWRDYTLNMALLSGFGYGLRRDGLSLGSETSQIVLDLLQSLPRCPERNKLVATALDRLTPNLGRLPIISDFLRLLEIEPIELLLQDYARELRSQGDPGLQALELELEQAFTERDDSDDFRFRGLVDPDWFESQKKPVASAYHAAVRYSKFLKTGQKSENEVECIVLGSSSRGVGTEEDIEESREGFDKAFPEIAKISRTLPYMATLTMIRCAYLEAFGATILTPTTPIPVNPQTLLACERAAERARNLLAIADPLTTDPFASEKCPDSLNFWRYFEGTIQFLQPVPTPIRDRWILHLLDCADTAKISLSNRELRLLQSETYLHETSVAVGLRIWGRLRGHLQRRPASERLRGLSLKYVTQVFREYSIERNAVIGELRDALGPIDESTAACLSAFVYTHGLPPPLPTKVGLVNDSISEGHLVLLSSFEDSEQVSAILYISGILKTKPFAIQFMEKLFLGNFDNVCERQRTLSVDGKLAFLHKVFGGSNGIFCREDPMAMRILASELGKALSAGLPQQAAKAGLMEDLCSDFVWRAGFPSQVRVELLASVFEWCQKRDSTAPATIQDMAGLISKCFGVLNAAGIRLLQNLVMEPKAFSAELSQYLRTAQHSVAPGPLFTPFHLSRADGVVGLKLQSGAVAGSMGRIDRVAAINGKEVEGIVQKSKHPSVSGVVQSLERPLKVVAKTLQKYGFKWGEPLIDRVVASCLKEDAGFELEARRTGMEIATVVSAALGARIVEQPTTIRIEDSSGVTLLVPKLVSVEGKHSEKFCFYMGELGPHFEVCSKIVHEQGLSGLTNAFADAGLPIERVAGLIATIFVFSLLDQRTLIKDFTFGNVGLIRCENGPGMIGLLDFGGVHSEFPDRDSQWILAFIFSIVFDDSDAQKNLLIDSALRQGFSVSEVKDQLPKLDQLLAHLGKSIHSHAEHRPIDLLEVTLATVYEEWHLSASVRDFVDSLRKVAREWGPYLSTDVMSTIALRIFSAGGEAWSRITETESFKRASQILKPDTPDRHLESSYSEDARQAYESLNRLPDTARLWMRSDTSSGANELQEFLVVGTFSTTSKLITLRLASEQSKGLVFQTVALKSRQGFISFEDDDGQIHYLHLSLAF